jgi:ribonucleoside-diphosphate reductase alpha chain
VRAVTARVCERLAGERSARITVADLSALVEATLIEAGHYDIAKALVMCRAHAASAVAGAPVHGALRLIRRSGDVVAWNESKIEAAIRNAFISLQADPQPAQSLTARVGERARSLGHAYVPIETVQDFVQEELVLGGHMRAAERYIVYRAERALLRAQHAGESPVPPAIPVLDGAGRETLWDGEDLRRRIVRGTGAHIESTNGKSQGVVPFLKLHNDQLVAVNQGGKRAGSGCAYLELWHNDIREFLELRRNTGDERRRTHDMNTATWIPDLFMKRMEARGTWTLFRSNDVPDLHETYGRDFEARYEAHERRVEAGELHGEQLPALELWKAMLKVLFETGHPWITFKDPCNVRSPQDHAGVVHSSNLCTEITLNTSEDETAVCNLGSVVIDEHLDAAGELDHAKLRDTIRIAVHALDCVIDVNFYPTEPARRSNLRHRPIGLGVMGLQYALYRKGVAFGSPEAVEFSDQMMEAIAYYAYEASSDLAAERGAYASYPGSKWDRGLLPPDTIDLLEAERGEPVEVPRGGRIDWTPLREKIAAQGMRNSNVLAIAPTATIANIMGTSPCIEPTYKNLFAKSNLSGDFIVLNPFLVRDLKAAGLWNAQLADELKRHDGDLDRVAAVPALLRERYRTAFQIPPEYLIDAAARRQKWIDQSQSLNLFLPAPDLKAMSHMYRRAWRAGLKTTYYLRTLGALAIEKSTVPAAACSLETLRNGEECEACQ